MPKPVYIRFRREVTMPLGQVHAKGEEYEVASDDEAKKIYGDDIEITRYADGSDYELSLKEQAAERKDAAEDDEKDATKGAKVEAKE